MMNDSDHDLEPVEVNESHGNPALVENDDDDGAQNVPLASAKFGTEIVTEMPEKRVILSMPCTGYTCNPDEIYCWTCKTCSTVFEWGFDTLVYCACGRTPATTLEFKCIDPNHGPYYEQHETGMFLKHLDLLKPTETLNILILGESGVGKSTWINAFVNSLNYANLREARNRPLISLIPTQFTITTEDFNEIVVNTGRSKNEVFKKGQSATQEARIYRFEVGNTTIRLIDTPGIGDVRGLDQDRINLKNILDTLAGLEELHGICILLKPNNARVSILFRFCVKELLTHLHRDASKNIMFCFTNSRGTFYRPGDTMPSLKALLEENMDVGIALNKNTVYCYDSEAYRFLAAVKNDPPVAFADEEFENFSKSWDTSLRETNRMLDHIRTLKPHPIKSTLNLNHARSLVVKLTRPLAEISRNIQTNKILVQEELERIEMTKEDIQKLKENLLTERTEIEVTRIDYPKTVCSNGNCVKVWRINENVSTTEYVQICHDHCYLSGVAEDSVGDPGLIGCWAMSGNDCWRCGHNYREHLHIYYDSKQVLKKVEDQSVKEALKKNMSAKEMKQKMIADRNQLIAEFEEELKFIQDASVKFAYFLKRNSITPYNDAMEAYLKHLIHEEKQKVGLGGNRGTLELLQLALDSYKEERDLGV